MGAPRAPMGGPLNCIGQAAFKSLLGKLGPQGPLKRGLMQPLKRPGAPGLAKGPGAPAAAKQARAPGVAATPGASAAAQDPGAPAAAKDPGGPLVAGGFGEVLNKM